MIAIGVFTKILRSYRLQGKLDDADFIAKYGTLIEGVHTYTAIGSYWNVLILARWVWTTLVLIFLRDFSEFQIMGLLLTSILF